MKNHNFTYSLIFFFVFCGLQLYGQKTDTTYVRITPGSVSDHTSLFQQAFNTKSGKALKIIVAKGNYKISSTIETSRPDTFISFEKGSAVYFQNNKSTGFIFKHDNIRFSNAKLFGNGSSADNMYAGYGIMLYGANHCTIENNEFSQISGVNLFLYTYQDKGSSNNVINNNIFKDPAFSFSKAGDEAAILLGYSGKGYTHNNNLITNNIIDGKNILKLGVALIGHGIGNIIKNNTISNCLAYGITAYESQYGENTLRDTKVLNNKVTNIGEVGNNSTVKGMGIYLLKALNSLVEGNVVVNTMRNSDKTETLGAGAISVSVSPNSIIRKNTINKSGMYGIVSDYSFNSVFESNKISDIRKSGMFFINMNSVIVKNNVFETIDDVLIKGYFEQTKNAYIHEKWNKDEYYDIDTGMNFTITGNKFNSPNQILYFYEDKNTNMIRNNKFENNSLYKNSKKIDNLVKFGKTNSISNKIINNQ